MKVRFSNGWNYKRFTLVIGGSYKIGLVVAITVIRNWKE